jgi:hypothetical protein
VYLLSIVSRCAVVILIGSQAAVLVAGQTQPRSGTRTVNNKGTSLILRTADGDPDLQGVWNFATATPLERPSEFSGKDVLTEREAAEFEVDFREDASADKREDSGRSDSTPPITSAGRSTAAALSPELRFAYNNFWYDENRTKFIETKRTSLVVDPRDGRIPPLTAAAQTRQAAERAQVRPRTDGPEDRGVSERCLVGFNSGPPMTPSYYNNNMQVFQGPGYVAILNEMIHSVRIIPLDSRPHVAPHIRQITGNSRGRWDQNTLIVETTNFTDKTAFRGATADLRLTERFTRVDRDTLLYAFTIDDPATWTRPWTVEFPMRRTNDRIYEYACHEGNYAMSNILAGARAAERSSPKLDKK